MNLQEQIINDAAEAMAKSIDTHILANFFIEDGWTEVVVDPWIHGSSEIINKWCKSNFSDAFIKDGNRWVIKDPKDATVFAIKWS